MYSQKELTMQHTPITTTTNTLFKLFGAYAGRMQLDRYINTYVHRPKKLVVISGGGEAVGEVHTIEIHPMHSIV